MVYLRQLEMIMDFSSNTFKYDYLISRSMYRFKLFSFKRDIFLAFMVPYVIH
jgi:hypothetical protein